MKKVSTTYHLAINAECDKVFAYVSDLTLHGEWNVGLRIESLTSEPPGVGNRYHTVGNVLKKDRPNELEVTIYQPPNKFAFVVQDPNFKEITHEFAFSGQDGGTLLVRTVKSNMPLLVWLFWRLIVFPFIDRPAMNKSLATLKATLER
jgi:Polyketide cyclase / dehydrase and lipid transport